MRIEELHLKNFRCFKELDIQFPESNLAVFIGLNGSGKSTILDAIYSALNDCITNRNTRYYSDDIFVGEKLIENRIVFEVGNEKLEWKINDVNSSNPNDEKTIEKLKNIEEKFNLTHSKVDRKYNPSYFIQWFEKVENKEFENQESQIYNIDFGIVNPKAEFVRRSINQWC